VVRLFAPRKLSPVEYIGSLWDHVVEMGAVTQALHEYRPDITPIRGDKPTLHTLQKPNELALGSHRINRCF
jgi:hypothetical protein